MPNITGISLSDAAIPEIWCISGKWYIFQQDSIPAFVNVNACECATIEMLEKHRNSLHHNLPNLNRSITAQGNTAVKVSDTCC